MAEKAFWRGQTPMNEEAKQMQSWIIVDYVLAKECKNKEVFYTCYKCGKCGRKFDSRGFMIDDGGTHPQEYEDE